MPGWGGVRIGAGRKPKPAPQPAIPAAPSAPYWVVIATHPAAEELAARELSRAGYRAYCPLDAERRPDPVIRSLFHKVLVPMVRGYIFVEVSGAEWVPIRHNENNQFRGVRSVLLNPAGQPGYVDPTMIHYWMDGDADRLNLASETMTPHATGIAVTIDEGPFAGHRGMVFSCDGLKTMVRIPLFGREVAVSVDRAAVRPNTNLD